MYEMVEGGADIREISQADSAVRVDVLVEGGAADIEISADTASVVRVFVEVGGHRRVVTGDTGGNFGH